MTMMQMRRHRPWTRSIATGLGALLAGALALLENVASSLVPSMWMRQHVVLTWAITLALLALTIAFAVRDSRTGHLPEIDSLQSFGDGAVTLYPISASAPGGQVTVVIPKAKSTKEQKITVVGRLPREPPNLMDRSPEAEFVSDLESVNLAVLILTGPRGVGKTQLAAAYARRCLARGFPLVAWVSAESPDGLIAGLADVARAIGVADFRNDSWRSAENVRQALESRSKPALLVMDNAIRVKDLLPYIPTIGRAKIIITSTDHAFDSLGRASQILPFSETQALEYMSSRTALKADEAALELAQSLGRLPLALAQAGTVIRLRRISYKGYLDLLNGIPVAELLTYQPGDPYPTGAAEAILLSLQAVDQADPSNLSRELLETLAILNCEEIDRTLLYQLVQHHAETAKGQGAEISKSSFDRALGQLVEFSLLIWLREGHSVAMHRLMARLLRERMTLDGIISRRVEQTARSLELIRSANETVYDEPVRADELVGHANALLSWVSVRGTSDLTEAQVFAAVAGLVNGCVETLINLFDTSRALTMAAKIDSECQQRLGAEHRVSLAAQRNRALALSAAGQSGEALLALKELFSTCKHVLGECDPDTLSTETSLAFLLLRQGHLREATFLFEDALAVCEQSLGLQHRETYRSRSGLAYSLRFYGRFDAAIALLKRNLEERREYLGSDDPETLAAGESLADAYMHAQEFTACISLLRSTIIDLERVLGPDHPQTLRARNALTRAFLTSNQQAEALESAAASLAATENVFGPDHQSTLQARSSVAWAYQLAGRSKEALALAIKNVQSSERTLGAEHPASLLNRRNLAWIYQTAGNLNKAIMLFESTLKDRERILGQYHPATISSGRDLADAYTLAKRKNEAIRILEQVVKDSDGHLGSDDPETLLTRMQLATAYQSARCQTSAIQLMERSLSDYERVLGPAHPLTMSARHSLGTFYFLNRQPEKAIPCLERTVEDRERVLGLGDLRTNRSRHRLALCYFSMLRISDARALRRQNAMVHGPHEQQDQLLSGESQAT